MSLSLVQARATVATHLSGLCADWAKHFESPPADGASPLSEPERAALAEAYRHYEKLMRGKASGHGRVR